MSVDLSPLAVPKFKEKDGTVRIATPHEAEQLSKVIVDKVTGSMLSEEEKVTIARHIGGALGSRGFSKDSMNECLVVLAAEMYLRGAGKWPSEIVTQEVEVDPNKN